MNDNSLLFHTTSVCHETMYNYVENILDERKMDQTSLNMSPFQLTHFINIDGLLMKSN